MPDPKADQQKPHDTDEADEQGKKDQKEGAKKGEKATGTYEDEPDTPSKP